MALGKGGATHNPADMTRAVLGNFFKVSRAALLGVLLLARLPRGLGRRRRGGGGSGRGAWRGDGDGGRGRRGAGAGCRGGRRGRCGSTTTAGSELSDSGSGHGIGTAISVNPTDTGIAILVATWELDSLTCRWLASLGSTDGELGATGVELGLGGEVQSNDLMANKVVSGSEVAGNPDLGKGTRHWKKGR